MEARILVKTDPKAAEKICLSMKEIEFRDSCLKSIAQSIMDSSYCELIITDEERDLCYYPFFMQGDYSVCEKLVLKESMEACVQMREISAISKQLEEAQNTTPEVPESNQTNSS